MTERMDDEPAEQSDDPSDDVPSVDTPGGPRKRRRSPILVAADIGTYVAVGVTAGLARPIPFLVALALSQLADAAAASDDYARIALGRGQFGIPNRSLVRELATFGLVLSTPWTGSTTRHLAAICLLAMTALRLVYPVTLAPLRRRRAAVPVETRNIDVHAVRLPPQPPRLLVTRVSGRAHELTLVGLVGAALGVALKSAALLFVTVAVVLVAEAIVLAIVVRLRAIGGRASRPEEMLAAVRKRISALRPEVVLYHTGDANAVYQANMWLSTIEALPRSSIVVLRERATLKALAPTTTPVLYLPNFIDFMSFGLTDPRVALYTANGAKNIHMLREQGVHHVFIGHGDSDKNASSNPFSKVYTQIWVAGPAGRDRYRRAGTGISDDDIVEVGRPQLAGIDAHSGAVGEEITVLYAPTWEGWTKDPAQANTSIIRTGPKLIDRLVALPGVTVVYKPHPLTGKVSRAAAAADTKIRATIKQAGAPHRTVKGQSPTLYECFNLADVLVADVSSVVSEFIASYKPYVVANLTSMTDEEFQEAFPSTSAAYLLDPAAKQIGAILDLIRTADPLADRRRELKHYLLGPDEPDALTRFIQAVEAAYASAVARCPVRPIVRVAEE